MTGFMQRPEPVYDLQKGRSTHQAINTRNFRVSKDKAKETWELKHLEAVLHNTKGWFVEKM